MLTIGFATEFYTLWDVSSEHVYFTDAYGNHHLTGTKYNYFYQKNISKDLSKVKELYPSLGIDEGLRGKIRSWSETKPAEDTTPEILKFGKHIGRNVAEVAELDFNYTLYLLNNCRSEKTKDAIAALPKVAEYFSAKQAEKEARVNGYALVQDGRQELTFCGNPNRLVREIAFVDCAQLKDYRDCNYAAAQITENHVLYVIFPQVQYVSGIYPYNMAVIDGKAKRIKNKTISIEIVVLHTEKNESACTQYAIIK